MAAVLPSGASPVSGYSMPLNEDDESSQSWEFLESFSADAGSFAGSGAGEMVFPAASPSIISQGSWNVVSTTPGQHMRALQTPSPVMSQNANLLSASPFSGAATFGGAPAANLDNGNGTTMVFDFSNVPLDTQQQSPQHQFVTQALLNEQVAALAPQDFMYSPEDLMISGLNVGFDTAPMMPEATFNALEQQTQFRQQLGIPLSMQGHANVEPWDPTGMQNNVFVSEQFTTPPPRSDGSSISLSPRSPSSPPVKQEPRQPSKRANQQAIHSVPRRPSGVQKTQKKKASTSPRADSPNHNNNKFKDGMLMFCNQTVDNWGKNAFGDMENIERSSQKGRKGALSEEVRANALKVRQTGACFCCHIRKVKCDQARPCKNCVKLCTQVPEAVCWKFADFNDVLFPDFIRGHFRKEAMAKFVHDNVASFTVNGVDTPCIVTLSSGATFGAKLVVKAKFFTARAVTSDIMQQWYHFIGDRGVDLEALRAAPIGLDIADGAASGSLRSELRRKVEAYVDALVAEPSYSLQLTDSIRKTMVPRKVLHLVQQYAQASGAPIVRRALSIYAMHYVMTRHLTMTTQSIASLQQANPVAAAAGGFMTPRLLNRQIKTIVDDVLQQEVHALFDEFTKRLKQKHRTQWAPCLAAFLVFTLLMEAIETAADVFAITDTEIEMRSRRQARFSRAQALEINNTIENMPFKQFAFQFHNIYSTHSRDASAKSFNPLCGEDLNDLRELDPAGLDLVLGLRNILQFDCTYFPPPALQRDDRTLNES